MNIVDPIYGKFRLPAPLATLCMAPEVRRLSQIRLLNTLTPSLASLGEIRRFSHTLGVLHLASQNEFIASEGRRNAFAAAVLLHDIGTPPFGHLFEYHLKERFGWNHEEIILRILHGSHVRENRAHQLFAGRTIIFRSLLEQSGVDLNFVEDLVSKRHSLSQLLFGTLDFDNLDNVTRMNWALGQLDSPSAAREISRHVAINEQGLLTLAVDHRRSVIRWLELRKNAYEVITFDAPTVAAQAVLSAAIETALESGTLSDEDWALTDEGLIEVLLKDPKIKKDIATQYFGQLPDQAFVIQLKGTLRSLGFSSRGELNALLNETLHTGFGRGALGYTFVDKGTFSKKIDLINPVDGKPWSVGIVSESVILHGFVKASSKVSRRRNLQVVQTLLDRIGASQADIMRCDIGKDTETSDAQQTLKI